MLGAIRSLVQSSRFVQMLLQLSMALFAICAVLMFWVAEAQACSPGMVSPDCDMQLDQQQMPDCIETDIRIDYGGGGSCQYVAGLDNRCDRDVDLTFFCDGLTDEDCPEHRVIPSGDAEDVVLHGAFNNRELRDNPLEANIAVEVELTDPQAQNADQRQDDTQHQDDESADIPESGLEVQMQAEYVQPSGDPCSRGPFGLCSSSPSGSSSALLLAVLAALGLVKARGRRQQA